MKTIKANIILMQPAMAAALALGLQSCTDTGVDSPTPAGGREISFEVREASGWNSLNSRSGAAQSAGQTLVLSDGSSKLYLTAQVSDGIDLDEYAPQSRGTTTDGNTIENFGVYASHQDGSAEHLTPAYMYNVEVTRSNDWTPRKEYLWPGSGTLHINAYSPYCDAAGTEGLTSLPELTSECPLSVSFVTPTAVADQFDLMYATPVDGSKSPCALSFNHALTAIRFATGSEMAPCTVKSVALAGIADSGTLSLETGEWSALTGLSSYAVDTGVELTAAAGSGYVASDVAITAADQTFLLVPQTLGEDARIELTIESGGAESTFTALLQGQTWKAGTTVTYRLSANPSHPGLILEVLDADGNQVTELTSKYTGGVSGYTVRSFYDDGTGASELTPVEWTAEFLSAGGGALAEAPEWISTVTTEGSGKDSCTLVTDLPNPNFLVMSEQTRKLRATADINTTSGQARYNLSSSTGGATVENTANCYVINAPGKYSLPLVYGNAIENGTTNTNSYISTIAATTNNKKHALLHFVNHLGNEITDPYIYNNASCTPSEAEMIWEDRLNLVRNVSLSADGHSIEFDIPAASIRQGNAELCVRDADGTVMWSWHLWITDYDPTEGLIAVPHHDDSGTSYIYERNIGAIYGGDKAEFEAASVTMRLTQKNVPGGLEPLSVDVTVSRDGITLSTDNCYSFFQFGRKDPMVTGLDQYYDAQHNELSAHDIPKQPIGTDDSENIKNRIQHPDTFFTGTDTELSHISPYYINLWDINQLHSSATGTRPENVKTIYDPSPAGAKVPVGNVFITLQNLPSTDFHFDSTTNAATFDVNGATIEILAMGYRSASGGETGNTGHSACWVALARSATAVQYFSIDSQLCRLTTNNALYGFAVRPVKE